jgi:hypothetical protein
MNLFIILQFWRSAVWNRPQCASKMSAGLPCFGRHREDPVSCVLQLLETTQIHGLMARFLHFQIQKCQTKTFSCCHLYVFSVVLF